MTASTSGGSRSASALKLGLLVVVLVVAYFVARHLGFFHYRDPTALAGAVRELRTRRYIIPLFVATYALATTLALPGSILTIAGGAIFGFSLGTLLNWIGASIGATLAFLLARSLGVEAVRRVLGSRADRLEALAGEHGFTTILRLRLIPAVPFNALNFAAGFAGVRFRDYVLGTVIGLLPICAVYTWFADALVSGAAGARRDALVHLFLAGGLLVLVSFLPALVKRVRGRRARSAAVLLALLSPLSAIGVAAAVPAPLRAQVSAKATSPEPAALHAPFDSLLRRHVRDGMVDYDAFERAPSFARYLAALDAADLTALSERDRLAFWINTYNAYTIALVVQHHERGSIRNINRSLGFLRLKGPWRERVVHAGGRTLTLDDVEHGIVRREFHEPRIHFALVCAAMGCPPLRSEAYVGDRLDAQLDDQARVFLLQSPAKNRVDVPVRVVHASLIFRLYAEDFGGSDAAVGRFIARWHPDGPARQILLSGDFSLMQTPYDWTLNSVEQAARLGSSGSPR